MNKTEALKRLDALEAEAATLRDRDQENKA